MQKVFTQNAGQKIAIGIKGTKEEREKLYNRIFNFGGTNGDLHELCEEKDGIGFSYFMAKTENVIRSIAWGIIQKRQLRGTGQKGLKATIRNRRRRACENGQLSSKNFFENCLDLARKEMNTWKAASFLPETGAGLKNFHRELDGGKPEWVAEFEE